MMGQRAASIVLYLTQLAVGGSKNGIDNVSLRYVSHWRNEPSLWTTAPVGSTSNDVLKYESSTDLLQVTETGNFDGI